MKTAASLEAEFRAMFAPPPKLKWWEWARDGGVILSPRVPTPMPGPYDVNRTPELIGIAEAMDDPDTRLVAICKGAQSGATQMAYAWLCCRIKFNPGPAMVVAASLEQAEERNANTLLPMFEDSPELATLLLSGRDATKKASYKFTTCNLYLKGGNSAKGLASNPIRDLIGDEIDKWDPEPGEGDNLKLAIARTLNFPYSKKVWLFSTPTTESGKKARIWPAYQNTDRRKMHLPCPKCGHRQVVAWKDVVDLKGRDWKDMDPQEAAADARIRCQNAECLHLWTDVDRRDSIIAASKLPDRGWMATAISKEFGSVGFHLPRLVSSLSTLPGMVADFLASKDTPSDLHSFVNNTLGEPWIPETVRAKSTTLDNCKAAYTWGTSPESDPHIAAMTKGLEFRIFTHGDVQKNGIWAWTQIYWATGHSALLSFQFVGGYKDLEEFAQKEWDIGGKKWQSHLVSIDCGDGNRTKEIYDQCAAYGWTAAKGANRELPMLFEYKEWNLETGRAGGDGVVIPGIYLDTGAIKHNLIAVMDGTQQISPEDFAAGVRPKGPQFWIPNDIPDTVPRQLTSEEYDLSANVWRLKKGRAGADGNHLLDCAVNVYGLATFYQLCFREIA